MNEAKRGVSSHAGMGMLAGKACADALFHAVSGAFGESMLDEQRAVSPLSGGILQHGYQCGVVWGAALAAGARAYRLYGASPEAETAAIAGASRIVDSFRAQTGHLDCYDITGIDDESTKMQMVMYFLVKGGTIGCIRQVSRFAPAALAAIQMALSDRPVDVPAAPVSCAALTARRMGASDMHATMAAGFAGGIGLSGGGCGALGAAIWMLGLKSLAAGGGKIPYKAPAAVQATERFLKCTGYEIECEKIVGRKFASPSEHAAWVRDGGCTTVIDALAAV